MSLTDGKSRGTSRAWGACPLAGLITTLWATPEPAQAGWRELGFVFVHMDSSEDKDKDARRCYTQIRKAITSENSDLVHVRLARDTLARKLGEDATSSWLSADRKAFEPLVKWEPSTWRDGAGKVIKGGGYVVDAWVLIDCQPAKRTLDIVTVAPATGSVMHLHLGERDINKNSRELAKSFVMGHAWADWSP
ncbi:MAG: hypothetical protein V3V08_03660 [Nannocystaceae bacterium]